MDRIVYILRTEIHSLRRLKITGSGDIPPRNTAEPTARHPTACTLNLLRGGSDFARPHHAKGSRIPDKFPGLCRAGARERRNEQGPGAPVIQSVHSGRGPADRVSVETRQPLVCRRDSPGKLDRAHRPGRAQMEISTAGMTFLIQT